MSSALENSIALLTLACLLLGGLSIYWAKADERPGRSVWGRRLFVLVLLVLGLTGLAGALLQAEALAPLGLLAGMLVVAMLWEAPDPFRHVHVIEES